jgi:enterochelin esterase family protein
MHRWLVVMVAGVRMAAQDPAPTVGGTPVLLRTESPEVRADRPIVFRLRAPGASKVTLQFAGLSPMTKGEAGIWTATVGPVAPDIYQYNFIVDGLRILDPGNPNMRNGWAIDASIVEVPGSPARFDELQDVPHGALGIRTYYSTVLKRFRTVYVYTPPQYERKKRQKFPVLVLRHGAGDTEENWSSTGRAGVILDNLIAKGQAAPMIAVMPNGDTDRSFAGANSAEGIELLSRELLTDILPMIERTYRTSKGRENRAIAGLAMGGGQAFVIGLKHLDLFAWVGEFGSGLLSDSTFQLEGLVPGFLTRTAEANRKLKLLYLSCGTDDPRYQGQVELGNMLEAQGIRHVWFATPGMSVEWRVGRRSLADFAQRLFRAP